MEQKLKADPVGVTLTFDGWTNVLNQNILGSVFITSEGEVLVWKGIDISGELRGGKKLLKKLKQCLKRSMI